MSASFNPTAWLEAFTADGGAYALAPDGRLWLGGFETKAPIEVHTAELVGHPDRVEAIKGIVRERCLIC